MNRSLAAKVLLPKYKNNRLANERLAREALLAGSIQHPGIPPVYEQGELLSGSRFFTMKLVEGKTLEQLLAARTSPLEDRQYFLNVFRQVADAVGFAHSRRVIHRDLKPQNVMVGEFGEVQIMDWGMAKSLDQMTVNHEQDSATETQTTDLNPISLKPGNMAAHETNSRSVDSSLDERHGGMRSGFAGLTVQGDIVGTPSYMSPEQAAGDVNNMNERSDVFSLGAVLFEILTGDRLYQDLGDADPVKVAAEADIQASLSTLDENEIDEDLVAICKQCLVKQPGERPANGQQVVHTVAAYLEGVESRLRKAEVERSSAQVKALEEKKRRQTFVKMVWAVGIVGCLGAIGIGWQWSQANVNLREANRQNEVRKAYFSKSLEAIDKMLTRVSYETLANVPGMGELRRELLEEALGFYQEFEKLSDDNDQIDVELAKIHKLAGTTHSHLGDFPKAEVSFGKALDVLEELAKDNVDDEMVAIELASCQALLANSLHRMGRSGEAAIQLEAALQQMEIGLDNSGNDPRWLIQLAEARNINATVLRSAAGIDAVVNELKIARDAFEQIPEEFATNHILASQTTCLATLSRYFRENSKLQEADEMEQRAVEIMQGIVDRSPDSPSYRNALVKLMQVKNSHLANKGFIEDAAMGFTKQLEIQKKLVRDFPSLAQLKGDLVRTYALLGAATDSLGRKNEAITLLQEGINRGEELLAEYPLTVEHLSNLGYIYKNIATARSKSRDDQVFQQSILDFKRSYDLQSEVVEIAQEDPDQQYGLATAAQAYAMAIYNNSEVPIEEARSEANVLLLESEALFEDLLQVSPQNSNYQYRLAIVRSSRAMSTAGSPDEAADLLQRAADGFERLVQQLPNSPQYRYQLAGTHDKKATLHLKLEQKEQWESELRIAAETMAATLEKFGKNARLVEYVSVSQNRLAHCIKTKGKSLEAEALFRSALNLRTEQFAVDKNNHRIKRKIASSNSNLAWHFAFWHQGDMQNLDLALEFAEAAVQQDPSASDHWTALAYIHFLRNKPAEVKNALAEVEPSSKLDAMTRAAINTLQLQKAGNQQEAEAALELANQLSQDSAVSGNWQQRLTSPEGFALLRQANEVVDTE